MKKFILFGVFSLLLQACQRDQVVDTNTTVVESDSIQKDPTTQQAVFEPPFEDIGIPFREYNYNSKNGLKFSLESGTVVEIPSNCFEDANGNQVSKNIQVKYREFHSISDIMLSGIKMKYNEGDTLDGNFESAGMFEIRAFANDQELNLRKNKTIKVDLAS